MDLTQKEKWYYLSNWAGNVHHATIFSYLCWLAVNSSCDNAYPFIWFYDDVCFVTVQKEFVYAAMLTMGYLLYDFIT